MGNRMSQGPTFELKSAGFTLPIIRLLGTDLEALGRELGAKVEQAPDFFRNTPVVIDLSALPATDLEFPLLVGLLRGHGMIPFGVRGGDERQHAAAQTMELAVLGESRAPRDRAPNALSAVGSPARSSQAPRPHPETAPEMPATERLQPSAFTLIARPIRSGQRIHAMGGDLSVVGAVSSGAELMADGNIHVYGPLRGRAMAGMNGNLEARIFCQDLQAELVSVAGHYRVSENIPAELRGTAVQIFLDGQALRIEPL